MGKYQYPGSKVWQWKPREGEADGRDIFRLTADMALLEDATYKQIVEEFAADEAKLKAEFKDAWHILTTRGGTWSPEAKCDDDSTPPKSQFEMRSDDVAFV